MFARFQFLIFVVLVISASHNADGQSDTAEINRLRMLTDETDGQEKIESLLALASLYQSLPHSMDSVTMYASMAKDLALETDHQKLLHQAYHTLGMAAWYGDEDFDKALQYFQNAKKVLLQIDNNSPLIATEENAIGSIYLITGKYEKALSSYQLAYDLAAKHEDYEIMAMAGTNMGIIYINTGDTLNCLRVNEESLEILSDAGPEMNLTRLGIMVNLGDLYRKIGKYGKVETLLEKAGKISDMVGSQRQKGRLAILKARMLDELNRKADLYKYVNEILPEYEKVEGYDREIYTRLLIYKGEEAVLMNDRKGAENVASTLSRYIPSANHKHKLNLLRSLHKINASILDHKAAYNYHLQYTKLKDSLYNDNLQKRLIDVEKKYEVSKKTQLLESERAENLELRNSINTLLALLLLAIVVGLSIYLYQYRKRQDELRQINEIEQKILALQLNPHFIFNAISSIQNYLYDDGDRKQAIRHLSTFATLMREMLENSRERFITVDAEVKFLNHYLELQKLRFDGNFDYRIHVDEAIDVHTLCVPPLMTQPFVENAIEHGKIYDIPDGQLVVRISKLNERVHIDISDNGLGIDTDQKIGVHGERKKKSLSLKIINERLALLTKLMNKRWNLEITNGAHSGTVVRFDVPAIDINNIS